jgi:hypothetical protein
MAALTAASFTTVVSLRGRTAKRKMHRGTLTFGNGTDTYPTAGIPLPTRDKFGFTRVIEELIITGNNARTDDYVYRYNKAANKLLMYEEEAAAAGGPLLECDVAEAPTARTLNYIAYGW